MRTCIRFLFSCRVRATFVAAPGHSFDTGISGNHPADTGVVYCKFCSLPDLGLRRVGVQIARSQPVASACIGAERVIVFLRCQIAGAVAVDFFPVEIQPGRSGFIATDLSIAVGVGRSIKGCSAASWLAAWIAGAMPSDSGNNSGDRFHGVSLLRQNLPGGDQARRLVTVSAISAFIYPWGGAAVIGALVLFARGSAASDRGQLMLTPVSASSR